jgi:hypothetical protein
MEIKIMWCVMGGMTSIYKYKGTVDIKMNYEF